MHKGFAALWQFLSAAPVMVSIGMTALILGGVSGSQFLDSGASPGLWPQFGILGPHDPSEKTLNKPLRLEIESLKRQSASDAIRMVEAPQSNADISMLSYAQASETMEIRRDPFAPLAPPKEPAKDEKGSLQVQMAQPKANVIVPGDYASQTRKTPRRRSQSQGMRFSTLSSNIPSRMIPAAMAVLEPPVPNTSNQTAAHLIPRPEASEAIQ